MAAVTPKIEPQTEALAPAASKTPVAPERHEDELAAIAGVAGFPGTFTSAAARGDEQLARGIFVRRLAQLPQQSAVYQEFLKPYMEQYPFLWHEPLAIGLYLSSCVDLNCDKEAIFSRLQKEDPDYYEEKGACLKGGALMVPLVKNLKVKPSVQVLSQIDQSLQDCLDQNIDSDAIDQLQHYLYYLDRTLGKDAAYAKYQEMAARFPGLPAASQLLPAGKA